MRSLRAISINNALVQGICNYNCVSCSVNKPSYDGAKMFQNEQITSTIVNRIKEALQDGVAIRNVDIAGNGEPTLHPDFSRHIDIFGTLRIIPQIKRELLPTVSVVTNGTNLHNKEILDALERNNIALRISFPTVNQDHYAKIMTPHDEEFGKEQYKKVCSSIDLVMERVAKGKIPKLTFHISPPVMEFVRPDFPETIAFLAKKCRKYGLKELFAEIIPGYTNKGGRAKKQEKPIDMFRDYFRQYNDKHIDGVKICLFSSAKHFYPSLFDIIDVLRAFRYPCLYYGNVFLTAKGDSICCNDQSGRMPVGNIIINSLREIMTLKEDQPPLKICRSCNVRPDKIYGSLGIQVYKMIATFKARRFFTEMRKVA